jgi:hypothetical protein
VPKYVPTVLIAMACCNVMCMLCTLGLGGEVEMESSRSNSQQGG